MCTFDTGVLTTLRYTLTLYSTQNVTLTINVRSSICPDAISHADKFHGSSSVIILVAAQGRLLVNVNRYGIYHELHNTHG